MPSNLPTLVSSGGNWLTLLDVMIVNIPLSFSFKPVSIVPMILAIVPASLALELAIECY